jgi:hypothetical protein
METEVRVNHNSLNKQTRMVQLLVLLPPGAAGLCAIYFAVIGFASGSLSLGSALLPSAALKAEADQALGALYAATGTPFWKVSPTPTETPTPRPTATPIGPPVALDDYERLFRGVYYKRQASNSPRPHIAHIVIINLNDPRIDLMVTPGDDLGQTTSRFLESYGLQLAINADGWGLNYDPHGFAASEGKVYSEASREPTIYISRNEVLKFDGAPPSRIWDAISGSHTLVEKGRLSEKMRTCALREVYCEHLAPRTSIGVSAGNYMIIILVEGPPSAPRQALTLEELAKMHRQFGSIDAIAMDGGGSTTLAVENGGAPHILNSPSDGTERAVANHLGIFVRGSANSE